MSTTTTRSFNPTAPIRVLVVDDDEVDRESVRRLLARANIEAEVVEEADALAALAILRRATFDVVVLDYHFPRHDGLLILRELREFDAVTPVIMLTGHDDTALAVELMQNGAADYIPKSTLSAQRLAHSVRHVLRLRVSEVATRAVQEALRASEALGRRLLEASSECVTVLGLEGRLLAMSTSGQRLLGLTDAAVAPGRPWLEFWVGDHAVAATAALAQARRGQTGRFQGLCMSQAGASLWWDVTVTAIPGADEQPERLLALWRDITAQRRQAKAERRVLQVLERELERPSVDMDRLRGLRDLFRGRVDERGVPLRRTTDIHALCRSLVEEAAREHPGRAIVHQAQGDGQGAWDPSLLAQALGGLVHDAIDHSSATITVRSLDLGVRVAVEVHEQGTSDDSRLSGPGSLLAHEIVEAHDGDILHTSAADGTTLRVELPRA
jgi:PAS domain S-box-containing protein